MWVRSGVNGACLVVAILASLAAPTACLPAAHSSLGVLRTQGPASFSGSASRVPGRRKNLGFGGPSSLVRLRGGGEDDHGHSHAESHSHAHSHSHSAHAHTSPVGGLAATTFYRALHDLTVQRPEMCAMVVRPPSQHARGPAVRAKIQFAVLSR